MGRWKQSAMVVGLVASCAAVPATAFTLVFSNSDFTSLTPVFSNVTTFNFDIEVSGPLASGSFADPVIDRIEYNVSGGLDETPSGFSGFSFQLSHLIAPPPAPPTSIPGDLFYSLNDSAIPGTTLLFDVAGSADLSDGLQVSELNILSPDPAAGIGSDVVFHFNGREEGTGRYHPLFLQLFADGTGIVQNADNQGGINPITMEEVNVNFGEEYITNLNFDPANFTIGIPESSTPALLIGGAFIGFCRRRRRG
jgi:hypothetical protein